MAIELDRLTLEFYHVLYSLNISQEEVNDEEPTTLRLTPDTLVTVMYTRYRTVVYLDISPSMAAIDRGSGMVLFESLYLNLELTLKSLVQPIVLAGGQIEVFCFLF